MTRLDDQHNITPEFRQAHDFSAHMERSPTGVKTIYASTASDADFHANEPMFVNKGIFNATQLREVQNTVTAIDAGAQTDVAADFARRAERSFQAGQQARLVIGASGNLAIIDPLEATSRGPVAPQSTAAAPSAKP